MSKGFIAVIAVVTVAALPLAQGAVSPGPLVVWGSSSDPLVQQGPPSGDDFVTLADGGALQTLAIRADGTLYLSGVSPGMMPAIPPTQSILPSITGLQFAAVGMGRSHGLAIRTDGRIIAWPSDSPAVKGTPPTGQFIAVTGNGGSSVALDVDGNVVVWGAGATPAPAGLHFQAIAARQNYMLALGTDGNIYGWGSDMGIFNSPTDPWTLMDTPGQFMAPREAGIPYTAIAAGLGAQPRGLITALRADGKVVVWDPSLSTGSPPAGIVFSQPRPFPATAPTIAAGLGYAVGIDVAGHLQAWGDPNYATVPPGVYSAVSAATGHVTAIAVPDPQLTALAPANLWLGLKNSDDTGTRFDLLAEVFKGGTLVGSGQLGGVAGGSSGFNNAVLRTIPLTLNQPMSLTTGDTMSVRLSVRIAQDGAGHRSGTARLWFNDAAANSRFGATIGGYAAPYYVIGTTASSTFALKNTVGTGPRRSVDVFVDRAAGGNPFKPFGTWSIVLP